MTKTTRSADLARVGTLPEGIPAPRRLYSRLIIHALALHPKIWRCSIAAKRPQGCRVDLRPGLQDDEPIGTARYEKDVMSLPPRYQQIARDAEVGSPDAQFLLSQICMQNGDTEGMMLWLQRAIDSGVPDALGALGRCYENGHGVQRDMGAALQHYERAVASGSKVATFDNAQLLHKSRQGITSSDRVFELLVTAAEANVTPAFRVLGYVAMQHESTRKFAMNCLQRASDGGDSVASFMLGSLD